MSIKTKGGVGSNAIHTFSDDPGTGFPCWDNKTFLDLVYPVGSLYWSSNNTNPSQLFGGTWTQIKDKFVLAAGDTYANSTEGGVPAVILTVEQIPSHKHDFTPSGTVSSHAHGIDIQKYPFSGTTGESNADITIKEATGFFLTDNVPDTSGDGYIGGHGFVKHVRTDDPSLDNLGGSIDTVGHDGDGKVILDHSHDITQTKHSHSFSGTIDGISGDTEFAEPEFTGTEGTTVEAGSSQSHNNMPPYIVKYCWERTA